ncbi:LytTR family transcriptional regulator [Lacihabitans sp. LS3-19]|uniref:LytTR family DNA-binding domain-containing protein n=1 Tax=Lacihabitans sp. LS3-19 TaxID=2487335 RepID=UPI0020CE5005|nr:LytTR family DNA-binding domain-containing protein [Lacihabitans sp. LS3-19]MCP9767145.1 LytTR family transcriptional regulator [Lacihabitans sp. LS3-19]
MKTRNYGQGIVLLEADSNYTILHKTDGAREISSYTMKWHIERLGTEIILIRPIRKFCVNLQFLKAFNGNFFLMNHFKRPIPVSRRRKEQVESQLHKYMNQSNSN